MVINMEHSRIDKEIDRDLLNDIFNDIYQMYIIYYLYIIRKRVFLNYKSPEFLEAFISLKIAEIPTNSKNYVPKNNLKEDSENFCKKSDLEDYFPKDVLKYIIQYGLIQNIHNFEAYESLRTDFVVIFQNGIKFIDQKLHITKTLLMNIILSFHPFKIKDLETAIKNLQNIDCSSQRNIVHNFIHLYEDNLMLDDDLYNILDECRLDLLFNLENLLDPLRDKIEKLKLRIENYLRGILPAEYFERIREKINNTERGLTLEKFNTIILKNVKIFENYDQEDINKMYHAWERTFLEICYNYFQIIRKKEECVDLKDSLFGRNQTKGKFDLLLDISEDYNEIKLEIAKKIENIKIECEKILNFLKICNIKQCYYLRIDLEKKIIEYDDTIS